MKRHAKKVVSKNIVEVCNQIAQRLSFAMVTTIAAALRLHSDQEIRYIVQQFRCETRTFLLIALDLGGRRRGRLQDNLQRRPNAMRQVLQLLVFGGG